MKALFYLLLLVNLVLAIYLQFGSNFDNDTKLRPELQPEKIRLLSLSAV